jgi:hypothetical protein
MRIDACARRQSIWLVGLNYCLEQIMLPSALCHGGFLGFSTHSSQYQENK